MFGGGPEICLVWPYILHNVQLHKCGSRIIWSTDIHTLQTTHYDILMLCLYPHLQLQDKIFHERQVSTGSTASKIKPAESIDSIISVISLPGKH